MINKILKASGSDDQPCWWTSFQGMSWRLAVGGMDIIAGIMRISETDTLGILSVYPPKESPTGPRKDFGYAKLGMGGITGLLCAVCRLARGEVNVGI